MQVFLLALKIIGLGVATYVVIRLAAGRPLYPVPLFTAAFLIVATVFVCRLRVSWGTALVFQDSAVVFLRDSAVIYSIPRGSILRVQLKKDSLTFRHQVDRFPSGKVVGREGFTPEVWKALTEYATCYVPPQTKSS